jgi:hypothetical protein
VTGHECANDHAAQQHAQKGDNLIAARDVAVASLKGYCIQVTNEIGKTLFTVPLSKRGPTA